MFRIDSGLKDEPLLISQLVRMAAMSIIIQPLGEGLAERRWSDVQLQVLQERLQKTDLIASTVQANVRRARHLRQSNIRPRGYFPSLFPHGWARLEQLNLNRPSKT